MAAAMIKTIRRNARTYSLQPSSNEAVVDGYVQKTAVAASNISAHIQPMSYKDLRNVPEGQNTLQWITIWSEVNLPEKDLITYGGVVFTIQRTQFWDDGGFYKAHAVHTQD